MSHDELTTLLFQIRDGDGDAPQDVVTRARQLTLDDPRVPDELKAEVLTEPSEVEADAAALLSLLGHDDLGSLLVEALQDELQGLDLAGSVLDSIGAPPDVPQANQDLRDETPDPDSLPAMPELADAVRFEAGLVELVDLVSDEIGAPSTPPLALAVRREAGVIDVVEGVMTAVREVSTPVAEAVRDEAGTTDVVEPVFAELGLNTGAAIRAALLAEAGTVDVAASVVEAVGGSPLGLKQAVTAEAGSVEVASAVASDIGGAPMSLRAALAAEAGTVDVTAAVLREISGASSTSVQDAVAAEAGTADVSVPVLSAIGATRSADLRAAVLHEAGTTDVAHQVLRDLGVQTLPLAASVAAEAGTVELWSDVAADLDAPAESLPLGQAIAAEAGSVDVTADVMRAIRRQSVVPTLEIPTPANQPWRWGASAGAVVMLAAAMLLTVLGVPNGTSTAKPEMQFASQSEIVVEDLEYGENVQVFEAVGDEGAVIIWFEEEV